ncbi:flagellar hook-associated protein FlgL [Syntrophomonas palmitatica]|uniref:flagellar hook-associated protein FlgL n=1 Tax=Syntrophomonas palmitatica TaxID=402877 RepID=UPI0006D1BB5C|nr:flagellar hook-associated protein FlgL [Syntrophomonas palmitatica]
MRITNGMMVNNLKRDLNYNMIRLAEYQKYLSTGRILNRPSDNPSGTVTSLRLRTTLKEGEQYLANINEATSFMQTTDSAMNNINEIIQKIRELTVKAATGTNDPDAHNAIAKEINELKDQLKIIANTTYGSKYIFGGTNVTEIPYENGMWYGNEDSLEVEIGVGVRTSLNVAEMKGFFMGRLNHQKRLRPPQA